MQSEALLASREGKSSTQSINPGLIYDEIQVKPVLVLVKT